MTKAELRKNAIAQRKALTDQERHLKSHAICNNFLANFNLENIKYVHVFLPIAKQKEIDTTLFITQLNQAYPAIQILIPKADTQTLAMQSYLYDTQLQLMENQWGILEPRTGTIVDPIAIDLVIIPLLAFDKKGYRVGYGKGFYDRFLVQCRKEVMKVGLSYEEPVEQIANIDTFDIPLHFCVTPKKVWKFV